MNYQKVYNDLINKAKYRVITIYTEKHHIVPKCIGGTNEESNIIKLTGREHFIAHLLLTKIYKNKKIYYAFNNMFRKSDDQERYLPISKWYEYRRELFSINHPCKTSEVREKISRKLKQNYLELNKFCEFSKCQICGKLIIGKPKKFCSSECRYSKKRLISGKNSKKRLISGKNSKKCIICGKLHKKKYCCSKECFKEYLKDPNNQYSKTLSEKRSKYIMENHEKIKSIAQKSAKNKNYKEIAKKISKTKRLKNSGNNNPKSAEIRIFNENNECVFISLKGESFKDFCIKNNLPERNLAYSYKNNTKLKAKFKNWYAIKIL